MRVRDDAGRELATSEVELLGPAEERTGIATLAAGPAFRPGLYRATVEVPGVAWWPRTIETGFWVKDAALLASGPRLSVSRDWLR